MLTEICATAPHNWQVLRIQDVCLKVTSGGTPSRTRKDFYEGGTVPWVKTQELRDSWIYRTDESISEEAVSKSSAKLLPENTVLMAMYGATVGQLGILRKSMSCNQACCAMIADPSKADFRFLYYMLLSSRQQLKSLASGAAQQNLSGIFIKSLAFPFPPLIEQKRIAAILGALDDKIELNRRMNETLEQMARALFKSWFIDFDPVHAKAAGRQPFGMDKATADLFPSSFEDSELGLIPSGFRSGIISEAFDLTMGQSPDGESFNEDLKGIPFYQGSTDFGFRFPTRRIFTTSPTRYAKEGDTLVSVRAPVGDINMASEDCCIGRGVAAIRHRTGARSFTYYAIENLKSHFDKFEADGTVFGSINKQNFESLPFVIPPQGVSAAFEQKVGQIDEEILLLTEQSRTLVALRDVLLPKLLSGVLKAIA